MEEVKMANLTEQDYAEIIGDMELPLTHGEIESGWGERGLLISISRLRSALQQAFDRGEEYGRTAKVSRP